MELKEITSEYLATLSDEELASLLEQVEDQKSYYHGVQYTKKIEINSLYGMLGASESLFYDPYLPASVTSYGRFSIRIIGAIIDRYIQGMAPREFEKLNVVAEHPNGSAIAYSHTDSVYFELLGLRNKYLKEGLSENEIFQAIIKAGNDCVKKINGEIFPNILTTLNARENQMKMNFEVYADKGLFLKKARYYMRIVAEEGVLRQKRYFKKTGIELKKSHTPQLTKALVGDEILDMFLDAEPEEIGDFLKSAEESFMTAPVGAIGRAVNVKKINEFEVSGEETKAIKQRILAFSTQRRKYVDKPYNAKYMNEFSKLIKMIDVKSENGLTEFLSAVNDFRESVNAGTRAYDGFSPILSKLSFLDKTYNDASKTKDGEDHTIGDIAWAEAFASAIDGNADYEFVPQTQFCFNIDEYIMKGLTANSKMALIHNKFLEMHKDEYPAVEPIRDGDKMKWFCLKTPNPFFDSDKVGIKGDTLVPLIEKYIDRKQQFVEGFETSVKELAAGVGVEFYFTPQHRFVD